MNFGILLLVVVLLLLLLLLLGIIVFNSATYVAPACPTSGLGRLYLVHIQSISLVRGTVRSMPDCRKGRKLSLLLTISSRIVYIACESTKYCKYLTRVGGSFDGVATAFA